MDEEQLRKDLDSHNKTLLSEIELTVPVKFTNWDKDYYASQLHKNSCGGYCEAEVFYKEPLEQPKIAHELLHSKTGLILGDNAIMFAVEKQTIPFQYMMKGAEHIGNVCEHVIFYPVYLEMGYKEEDFCEQAKDIDSRLEELSFLLKNGLKDKGHYSSQKVSQYLGLAFSFLFYPQDERFRKEVKQLQKIDVTLFSMIKKLKDACCNLDIIPENRDYIQEAYLDFAYNMNDWFAKAFKGAIFVK